MCVCGVCCDVLCCVLCLCAVCVCVCGVLCVVCVCSAVCVVVCGAVCAVCGVRRTSSPTPPCAPRRASRGQLRPNHSSSPGVELEMEVAVEAWR